LKLNDQCIIATAFTSYANSTINADGEFTYTLECRESRPYFHVCIPSDLWIISQEVRTGELRSATRLLTTSMGRHRGDVWHGYVWRWESHSRCPRGGQRRFETDQTSVRSVTGRHIYKQPTNADRRHDLIFCADLTYERRVGDVRFAALTMRS